MPRKVIGGLIQCAHRSRTPPLRSQKVKQAAIDAHVPFIEEAGKRGVQILGLQEVFNGPYFCPSQDPHWYDMAEPVPGPTTERMAEFAKKYQMAMVVPVYEREQAGVYYNTAAVYDADGTYLGKYRKNHIPHTSGFWEKYFFKPGNLGYPVFQTRLREGRRLHLLRPALPRGRAAARLERRRDRLQPLGHGGRPLAIPLEARAARARRRQRLLHGVQQPGRHRGAVEHRKVLRLVLLRRPARQLPRRRAPRTRTSS